VKIIVYDDSPDFGGHQIMACHGIEALASDPSNEILCMVNPDNRRLAEKLAPIASCQTIEIPFSPHRFQSVLNHVDPRRIKRLCNLFGQLQADLLLCIQGDIEHSSQALTAAHRVGLECISYIALPHHRVTMGARFGAWRDALNQALFRQPSRYIAISESMASLLRQRGVSQPIAVVPNGICVPESPGPRPREQLTVLGMLGRVEFKQKQQDFMVSAFCDFPQAFENCRLVIAGDGPDRNALEQLVLKGPRKADIDLLPWQNDVDAFFASIDILVIPSRFEGVPLVMLEALARGIPVIGSNRDGMKEILPASWVFEAENAGALADTFSTAQNNWPQLIGPLREKILSEHSLESFKTNFRAAVLRQ
jgi:glycosyltransferase involved in cell wall biosynthesis